MSVMNQISEECRPTCMYALYTTLASPLTVASKSEALFYLGRQAHTCSAAAVGRFKREKTQILFSL